MKKEVFVTRRERFSAAHKLYRPDWEDDKNDQVFGKCANPNWHGHNYEIFVTVAGTPDAETGFVMNLKELSKILDERVISKLDHKNLNLDVDFMRGEISSTEILAIKIWEEIYEEIKQYNSRLHCIKIKETENNFVEYYG
jgi:6-pyruvoyltetrahydropterin/6-carboxytetrahydropterin synthase